jgi:hypothetical protein
LDKIEGKEALVKQFKEQIKMLKGEIDGHIIEESSVSQCMSNLKEEKSKGAKHEILNVFFVLFRKT